MFKRLRSFIGGAVNAVKSFFGQDNGNQKSDYISDDDISDILQSAPDERAELIDTIADETPGIEDSAELEDIAQLAYEESINFAPDLSGDKGAVIDEFWEEYDNSAQNWPEIDFSALAEDERYHMIIVYECILNDGTVIERSIDRYNFADDEIINGMIWEDIFHQGDDDGNDISTGDVASVSYSVSYS